MNRRPWALSLPLLLLGAAHPACAGPPSPSTEAQEWRGQYGGDADPAAEVITHADTWARLWRRLDKPMPPLDFAQNCAVVAFAGQRPTGGFTLEFLAPVAQGDALLIRWRVRPPAPDAFVTQAFATPWKVKVFPRPKGQVKAAQVKD